MHGDELSPSIIPIFFRNMEVRYLRHVLPDRAFIAPNNAPSRAPFLSADCGEAYAEISTISITEGNSQPPGRQRH